MAGAKAKKVRGLTEENKTYMRRSSMVEGPACETTELQGLLCKKGGRILG
jgi:hypothetical protein